MTKWLICAVAIFVGWKLWKAHNAPFAGLVSSGWGAGSAQAYLPTLINPGAIVGQTQAGNVSNAGNYTAPPFAQSPAGTWN